jgi:hypothetical protein
MKGEKMKKMFAIGLTALFGATAFGTNQILDEMVYEGINYRVLSSRDSMRVSFDPWNGKTTTNYWIMGYTFLMEDYFTRHPGKHPQSLPRTGFVRSTALARGYVAKFEVRDKQLYLNEINRMEGHNTWKNVLPEVFPNQETVKMDWMTGVLVLTSEYFYFSHLDKEKGEPKSVVLEFDKGNLTKAVQMTGREALGQFIQRQYEVLEKTDEYQARRAELIKNENARRPQEVVEMYERASRMAQIFQREYTDAYRKAYRAFVDKINDRTDPVGNYGTMKNKLLGYTEHDLCDSNMFLHIPSHRESGLSRTPLIRAGQSFLPQTQFSSFLLS